MKKEMKKTKKKRIRLHRSLNITGEFKNDKLKKNITKIKETGVSQACFKIRANGNNKLEKSLLRFCVLCATGHAAYPLITPST